MTSKDPIDLELAVDQQSSGTGCQEMVEETDDDEEADDYKDFPKEIQIKFRDFIEDKLFPAVLDFMSKHYPRLFGVPIQKVRLQQLCSSLHSVGLSFNRKQQYDLFKIKNISILPLGGFLIMHGRDLVGAALRICGYIGQAGLADDLRTITRDCFIPDEEAVIIPECLKNAFFASCPSDEVANPADLIAGNCLNLEEQDGKAYNKDSQERLSQEVKIRDPVNFELSIVQQRLSPEMKIHDHGNLEPAFDQQRSSPEKTPNHPINLEPAVEQSSSGTFCQEVAVKTDDDEETDVYKKFPKEIQIKFRDFIDDKLFPAVLEFMSKSYPRLFGVPIRWVQFEQLCFCFSSLGLSFNRKQQYDLFKIRHALNLPLGLSIKDGQDWVGAALRICGYIGQAGLADDLRTIIGDCFIPDEEDVGIDDPFKDGFLEYSSDEDE